ncbi:MAG: rhodanese-like domain-containing protein [Flammeovirgaceae bacterium]
MKKILPLELKKLMDLDDDSYQLIDIRDEYEYDICCIGGEKINMYSIIDNLDKLSKEKKVIIYCRTGSRSSNVVNLLDKSYSFQNVYNLEGGIMKWRDDVDQTIKKY